MRRSNDRVALFGWCALSALLLVVVSIVDYFTPSDLALSLYYFLIVALVAWKTGSSTVTMGVALSSAAVWLAAESLKAGGPNRMVLLLNGTSRLVILVALGWVICRLKVALNAERALARTDFVTGALNARAFHEETRIEAERARRSGHSLTVAYVDLDNFKAINDNFGHSRGNDVLRQVAETMKSDLRLGDRVSRVGGDEFALLLPETGYARGRQAITRLQATLRRAMEQHGWPVTFSIGVAVFDAPAMDIDAILRKADEMMYQAKAAGKNRFRIYSQGLQADVHPIGIVRIAS